MIVLPNVVRVTIGYEPVRAGTAVNKNEVPVVSGAGVVSVPMVDTVKSDAYAFVVPPAEITQTTPYVGRSGESATQVKFELEADGNGVMPYGTVPPEIDVPPTVKVTWTENDPVAVGLVVNTKDVP